MTCPVIVVPEKATYDGIGQITFATDFHLGDIASLKKLTEFAKPFRSKIQVVHVSDPEYSDEADYMTKFKNKVLAKVDGKGIGFKYLEGDGSEKKLEKHLKSTSCALLAITTSDKTWMERLFFKNVSKKLIYHTRVPMIVFHNKS
jgi:nucleotide-binding universal stress UspA family protein